MDLNCYRLHVLWFAVRVEEHIVWYFSSTAVLIFYLENGIKCKTKAKIF